MKNPYFSKKPRKNKWFLNQQEANTCSKINDAFVASEVYTDGLGEFLTFVGKTYPDVPKELLDKLNNKYNHFQMELNELYAFLQNKMAAAHDTNIFLYENNIKIKDTKES